MSRISAWHGLGAVAAALTLLLGPVAHAASSADLSADLSATTHGFRSEHLGREVRYRIVRGPADDQPASRAPLVLYLLHGAGGDETQWLHEGALAPALAAALAPLRERPLLVVMPSFGPDSWWTDGAVDAAARAFLEELVPRVEGRHGGPAGRVQRAVLGISMGGFGALQLALERPRLFCAAALLSPAVYDPLPPADSAARHSPQFATDGRFDPARWRAANDPARWARYAAGSARVALWISSGDHDHLGIAMQAARLYERLRTLPDQPAELRITDGGHDRPTFDASLAPALTWLDARCR